MRAPSEDQCDIADGINVAGGCPVSVSADSTTPTTTSTPTPTAGGGGNMDGLATIGTRRPLVIGISGATCSGKTRLASWLKENFTARSARPSVEDAETGRGVAVETSDGSRVRVLNQDDYYQNEDLIPNITLSAGDVYQNWECSSSLRSDDLWSDIVGESTKWTDLTQANTNPRRGGSPSAAPTRLTSTADGATMSSPGAVATTAAGQTQLIIVEGFRLFEDPRVVDTCHLCLYLDLEADTCRERRFARDPWIRENAAYFDEVAWPSHMKYHQTVILPLLNGGHESRAVMRIPGVIPFAEVVDLVMLRLDELDETDC
eukprot:TRINITY_DN14753_c0_g1_i1.p1 TRINITY_DN14753_c0_g1~~TRINITY_DN14753_c0_g1_i1.p1  ORF type:complete len:317 (+),score=12.70 TRINITY_DN14753_c0_g1_i1:287-1237(+)